MPEARHYNASWIIGGFLFKKNTNRHCEVGFSLGWSKANPQVGAGRYSGDNPNNPTFATKQSIDRGQALPSAMTCDWQDTQKTVIAHSVARSLSLDCFANARNDAKYLLGNSLPKIQPSNDGKCHSEGEARKISLSKRSFGFHPQDDKKKAAFTLAEVLITLGIIGIVAAMTLPMLIAKYQKQVATTKLKRLYSLISNVTLRAELDYGPSEYWDYPVENTITPDDFFLRYYAPYIYSTDIREKTIHDRYKVYNYNGTSTGFDDNSTARGKIYRLPDETCVTMWHNNQYFVLTADITCEKGPNIAGQDVFDIVELYWMGSKKLVVPWIKLINQGRYDRDDAISGCKGTSYASGGGPNWCFALFVYDGLQFKDDYPWR